MRRRNERQLALDLRPVRRWGGRRPGAGRPPGGRSKIWHRAREPFSARDAIHLTIRVRTDVPSLRSVRFVRELERSLRQMIRRPDFRIAHYSVQSIHAHFLVEAHHPDALGRGAKALGARLARAANRVFGRRGPVLEDRYHQRVVRTPREARHAIAYVLLNARRHAGPGALPGACTRIDPASSGRWFDGWSRRTARAIDPPAIQLARTWLLGSAWRRHGLIDPGEVPGGRSRRRARRQSSLRRVRGERSALEGDRHGREERD